MDHLESKFKVFRVSVFRILPPGGWKKNLIGGVDLLAIIAGLIVNAGSVRSFKYELRHELWYPVNVLRLDQHWGMFSPNVLKKDGWFVFHGVDSVGRQWDL